MTFLLIVIFEWRSGDKPVYETAKAWTIKIDQSPSPIPRDNDLFLADRISDAIRHFRKELQGYRRGSESLHVASHSLAKID
ncbi:MAG: hypothetical protein AAB691_00370 [Patescibacteria group bacterium]